MHSTVAHRRWNLIAAWLTLWFMAFPMISSGQTALPSQEVAFYPRIEAGVHAGVINQLAVDLAQRWLVTASDDKTARIWDLRTGRLKQTLRPPTGSGASGQIKAVAISPDGSRIAVGGATGHPGDVRPIYLFDRASGRMIGISRGFSQFVRELRFSHDGRRLAAVFDSGLGLRVLDASDLGQELVSNDDCSARGLGVDFASDGRLVTSCHDGMVRLYDELGRQIAKHRTDGGTLLGRIRFSPDGERVAVSFLDSASVRVLSGRNLVPLYSPNSKSITNGTVQAIAWSLDGQRLYAAGRFRRGEIHPIVVWPDGGRGAPVMHDAAINTIRDLIPLAGDRVAYSSFSSEWGLLTSGGSRELLSGSAVLDLRGNPLSFRLSANAEQVEFPHGLNRGDRFARALSRFNIATRSLHVDVRPQIFGLNPPRTNGLPVTDWLNSTSPKFDGQLIRSLQPL